MAFLVSDRNRKPGNRSRLAMRLTSCADIPGACISPEENILCTNGKSVKLKSWNSQAVRKSKESTVKTNQDKNKNRGRVRKAHLQIKA